MILPDEGGPAKAEANAGRKKPDPLTAEQIMAQRARLKNMPEEEKDAAMKYLANYIVGTVLKWGFDFKSAPFSYEEMQGDPVEVISWDCYCSIYYGERRWPEDVDFCTVMVGIAGSKIDHIIKKFIVRKSHPTYSTDDENMSRKLEEEIDKAVGYSIEMGMRGLGIDIAIKAVGNNEVFKRYIEALLESNDYNEMSIKMDISVKMVHKIERELLIYLSYR